MTLAKTAILAESRMHLSDDFGAAVKQDKLAQIADPDAKYTGNPAAGSNGPRMADAVDRYVNGKVIKPVTSRTASIPTGGGGGGGGGSQ
jgi:hypothetical protein